MRPRLTVHQFIAQLQRENGTGRGRGEVWQPFGYFTLYPAGRGWVQLRELWVVPEQRGYGHARRSLTYLLACCKQHRFNVVLHVIPFDDGRASRATRASKTKLRAFYASCGFADDDDNRMIWRHDA